MGKHEGSALGPTAVAPVHGSEDSLTGAGRQHIVSASSAGENLQHNGQIAFFIQSPQPLDVIMAGESVPVSGLVDIEPTAKQPVAAANDLSSQRFYHGTRADLKPGELIEPGYRSNYGKRKKARYVYLTGTLDTATWGAELALGEGPGRIYIVEPTGQVMDDPNLTDKRYPGNPTKSYRSREPLQVAGEVTDWQGHSPEALQAMKDHAERLRRLGVEAIDD